jgi:hypothetical protein
MAPRRLPWLNAACLLALLACLPDAGLAEPKR